MKRITVLLVCILMTVSLVPLAAATGDFVWDNGDVLTTQEEQQLQSTILSIVRQYDFQPIILTVWSLDGRTAQSYAEDYFLSSGYGAGENKNGILFLISMEYRDWAIVTHGDTRDVVTDSDIDDIADRILPDLSAGRYYDAFDGFLQGVVSQYKSYENRWVTHLLIALAIGAVAAGIAIFVMRRGMNTVRRQSGAGQYLENGSFDLYRCHDFFLFSRQFFHIIIR